MVVSKQPELELPRRKEVELTKQMIHQNEMVESFLSDIERRE